MKKFIVACNNGVATSQTIACKVQSLLEENGINNATVEAVDIRSISTYLQSADAYICIMPPDDPIDLPMVNGVAFLTGIGQDVELEKLMKIARS